MENLQKHALRGVFTMSSTSSQKDVEMRTLKPFSRIILRQTVKSALFPVERTNIKI